MRRSALYAPTLAHRDALEALKRRRPTIDQFTDIDPAIWTIPCQSSGGIDLPSIAEIESSLPDKSFLSLEEHEDNLRGWWYANEVLTGFYSSRRLKRWSWELTKSTKAERDWAVEGALRLANPEGGAQTGPAGPVLFVYGNGAFRTSTNLPSKHVAFKHYFYQKVCLNMSYRCTCIIVENVVRHYSYSLIVSAANQATSLGYVVVQADEYLTSSMCPGCTSNGIISRLAKPTSRPASVLGTDARGG